LSGLVADDKTMDMKGQTRQICSKIDGLLSELGSDKQHVLMATIFITDFHEKAGMNEAWAEWLPASDLPSRATIGVNELGERTLIEVTVIAAKSTR